MSASSLNRKVAEIQKMKKMERRNAAVKRYESENDIVKHIETEVGGISAETSGGDSFETIKSEAPKEKPKKSAAKKTSSSKKGWASKKLLSDS
jgi:hypothetical protein